MLIVTPASLKYQWADELQNWLGLEPKEIQLFQQGKEEFNPQAQVFIMSYQLAAKRGDDVRLKGFKVVIADEAHYLKARDSQRSQKLLPIMEQSKRCILLSGTPVLNKPAEVFNLIRALRPDVCPNFKSFANRYCDPETGRFGIDYSGASCTTELHFLLETAFMIRRLKKDVLDQLPDKRRQQVQIQPDAKIQKQIAKLCKKGDQEAKSLEDFIKNGEEKDQEALPTLSEF